jgi:hypothetical protein
MLAEELPDATFVAARDVLEWRRSPQRLDDVAAEFVAGCFAPRDGARQLHGH